MIFAVFCGLMPPLQAAPGDFSLGARSTVSAFSSTDGSSYGTGGLFRIHFLPRMNSEWFADVFTSELSSLGRRDDYHIGWSILFYLTAAQPAPGVIQPYLIAGHCFDYTEVSPYSGSNVSRWSSAVQAGLGSHFFLSERADLSLAAQYMMHLGDEIAAEAKTDSLGNRYLSVDKKNGHLEGHVLVSLSANYRLVSLW